MIGHQSQEFKGLKRWQNIINSYLFTAQKYGQRSPLTISWAIRIPNWRLISNNTIQKLKWSPDKKEIVSSVASCTADAMKNCVIHYRGGEAHFCFCLISIRPIKYSAG